MDGRLEHELQINKTIKNTLNGLPDYVVDFYYSIQAARSPRTCSTYLGYVKRFIEFIGTDDMTIVTERNINEFLESVKYTTDKNGNMKRTSSAYTKIICSSLSKFFTYLYHRNIIQSNPMSLVERPLKKDSIKREFLSIDDLNKILSAVKNDYLEPEYICRNYAILYLFMTTGMRRTALSEINLSSIDFARKEIVVIDKRDKEQIYTITPELERVLKEWIKCRNDLLNNIGIKEDALFISRFYKRMEPYTIYEMVIKYAQKALGKHITPHKLRAAFASIYYEKTNDIEATREAVGHADISTTKIYITKRNSSRKDAAEFMANNLKL